MKQKLQCVVNRILGMKLGFRMFLIYFFGGVLPLVTIGFYLISGTKHILVEKAENTEIVELQTAKRQILEHLNTLTNVSQYFYFDSQLEEIASKHYKDYQEMVTDYKNYTAFMDYRRYYNNLISRISIYFQNDTLKGNTDFVVVDEKIESEEWYQKVCENGRGAVWASLPYETHESDHALGLARMLKTRKGADVGVLVIYLRQGRLKEIIQERETNTFIVLNGEEPICSVQEKVPFSRIKELMPEQGEESVQKRISLDGEEYVMTCETVNQKDTLDTLQIVSIKSLSEILAEANRQNVKSIWLSCISVAFAMLMIMLFSWSFGRRVEHFREQMQKASEGEFELEEKLGGNDEISQLYDYLSIMIWKIQRLLSEVYREQLHAEQLKTRQKDVEFKMLTSQINPHFLYNTLETIRMKARVNRQYEIEELVKMLAKILRQSIQAGENDVTVRSAMELVEYYLKIQQYRFGERIQYHISVEEDLKEFLVLPLLLQPLVENAIIHGLEEKEEVGNIDICIIRQGTDVVMSVEDNGQGIAPEQLAVIRSELGKSHFKGEHIGICNVHQRVRLKYGEDYGVSITSILGEKTRVEIRIPGTPVVKKKSRETDISELPFR